jgi:hypothetical protein
LGFGTKFAEATNGSRDIPERVSFLTYEIENPEINILTPTH